MSAFVYIKKESSVPQGPTLLRFPAPDKIGAREALQAALDADLTNVIILSQRESGDIYHIESDGLTLANVNWIIDSYKWWFWKQTDRTDK